MNKPDTMNWASPVATGMVFIALAGIAVSAANVDGEGDMVVVYGVNPATKAGPAYEDMVPDRAIWFKVP